jgi:hypothetical protein
MRLDVRSKASDLASRIRRLISSVTKPRPFAEMEGPSAGLAKVTIWYPAPEDTFKSTNHIVAEDDLETFLRATLELHFEPGYNPHSGGSTSQAMWITVARLRPRGPFWWSVPGLNGNGDPAGALLWDWDVHPETVWVRPDFVVPGEIPVYSVSC